MRNLKEILGEYAAAGPQFGDESLLAQNATQTTPRQIEQLKADLAGVRDRNKIYFVTCFTLLLLLFVTCYVFVVLSLGHPDQVKSALAATGLSFFGIVMQMLKLWKEKIASDLTLALASNVGLEDVRPMLEIVLRGLR